MQRFENSLICKTMNENYDSNKEVKLNKKNTQETRTNKRYEHFLIGDSSRVRVSEK